MGDRRIPDNVTSISRASLRCACCGMHCGTVVDQKAVFTPGSGPTEDGEFVCSVCGPALEEAFLNRQIMNPKAILSRCEKVILARIDQVVEATCLRSVTLLRPFTMGVFEAAQEEMTRALEIENETTTIAPDDRNDDDADNGSTEPFSDV